MFANQMVVMMTHRQQEIVDHAIELIAEGGVQVLTMKRLASRLGVSEPAIYRHFAGKADILLAILDQFESRVMSLIRRLDELQEPEQVLDQFFNNQVRQFSARPAMASVVFAEELFRNDRRLSDRVYAIMQRVQAQLTQWIQQGQKQESLRKDVDPEMVACMIQGSLRLMITQWRLSRYTFDLQSRSIQTWKTLQTLIK